MIDHVPATLLEAVKYFSDLDVCNEFMAHVKWPRGKIICPKCGGESVTPIKNRPKLQCNSRKCKAQFSYKVGTIFEDSPLGLDKWFVAVWCIANMKNGISSHELRRAGRRKTKLRRNHEVRNPTSLHRRTALLARR